MEEAPNPKEYGPAVFNNVWNMWRAFIQQTVKSDTKKEEHLNIYGAGDHNLEK